MFGGDFTWPIAGLDWLGHQARWHWAILQRDGAHPNPEGRASAASVRR